MCGIIGMHSTMTGKLYQSDVDVFMQGLLLTSLRGKDSTGVASINLDGKVDNPDSTIVKVVGNPFNLYGYTPTEDFRKIAIRRETSLLGHCRAATIGSVVAENAHPFKTKTVTLVHNGTLRNFEALKKDYKKFKNTEVDSHLIAQLLDEYQAKDIIEELRGAWALMWFDSQDKTLNVCRNTDRPLYVATKKPLYGGGGGKKIWASEKETLEWMNSRSNLAIDSFEEVPPHKIFKFHPGQTEPEVVDVKVPAVSYPVVSYGGRYGGGDGLYDDVYCNVTDSTSQQNTASNLSLLPRFKNGDEVLLFIVDYKTEWRHGKKVLFLIGEHAFDDGTFEVIAPDGDFSDYEDKYITAKVRSCRSHIKGGSKQMKHHYTLAEPVTRSDSKATPMLKTNLLDADVSGYKVVYRSSTCLKKVLNKPCGWCMREIPKNTPAEDIILLPEDTLGNEDEAICPDCSAQYLSHSFYHSN